MLSVATAVPLAANDPLRSEVEAERRELLDFYQGAQSLHTGQRDRASVLLRSVLSRDPANPYYRWVLGAP